MTAPRRAGRPDWLVIARREFLERVRSPWFIVVTLLGPVLMVATIVLPALIGRTVDNSARVQVVDRSPTHQVGPAVVVALGVLNRFGYDYSRDFGEGVCPKTFSIIGVMSWQDPDWGRMLANQNGTFPFSRDSTAFALDYAAAHLRGCMEGWITWLNNRNGFQRGDLWGCVGVWYAGDWKIPSALQYSDRVKDLMADRLWLRPDFAESERRPPTHPW